MISLYCQICGMPFGTRALTQRTCSAACRGRMTALVTAHSRHPVKRQLEILDLLRAASGGWVPQRALASALYGRTSRDDGIAAYQTIWRLRHAWSSSGLVIDQQRTHGETHYRLVSDIQAAESVSA